MEEGSKHMYGQTHLPHLASWSLGFHTYYMKECKRQR